MSRQKTPHLSVLPLFKLHQRSDNRKTASCLLETDTKNVFDCRFHPHPRSHIKEASRDTAVVTDHVDSHAFYSPLSCSTAGKHLFILSAVTFFLRRGSLRFTFIIWILLLFQCRQSWRRTTNNHPLLMRPYPPSTLRVHVL